MHPSVLALAGALVLLGGALSAGLATAAPGPANVQFLFDLGDGTYVWSPTTIPETTAANATWDATLAAAAAVGLYVKWSWSSSFGAYILDVGNRSPPGGVGLYVWNGTGGAWEAPAVGLSSLVLHDGDAVAISDNGFDPVTYATLYPVPTPLDPYPVLQFRGDTANTGRSRGTAPDQFRVRWDHDLHLTEIPSSPAVGYGRVYVLTLDGLFALNLVTGLPVWSNASLRGLSTPALFNGNLVFGGSDGRVHAVDAATGVEAWNVSLIPNPLFSGVTSSPKILFDTAYVGTFNESGGPGRVVALWATNGTIQWDVQVPASVSFSSPAIVNGTVYVGLIGKYNTTTQITYDPPYGVLALDAATGTTRWFAPTNGSVAASPLVDASRVVAPSKDGFVYGLNASTGIVVWKTAAEAGVSSPALAAGTLVVGGGSFGSGGIISALDPATGASVWSFAPNGPVESSIAAADGKVFFSTNTANGTVYALNATSGRLDWSYTPRPAQFIFGSPVVADGMVIAPSDNGHVYAFASALPNLANDVNLTAPTRLDIGQTGNVSVRVSAPDGTWDVVQLTVTITPGVDIVSTSAPATQKVRQLFVDLGPVVFGQTRWFNVTARGNASGFSTVNVFAEFVVRGTPSGWSPAVLSIAVGLASTGYSVNWPLLAGIAAVAVIAIIVFALWLDRRRVRGP